MLRQAAVAEKKWSAWKSHRTCSFASTARLGSDAGFGTRQPRYQGTQIFRVKFWFFLLMIRTHKLLATFPHGAFSCTFVHFHRR